MSNKSGFLSGFFNSSSGDAGSASRPSSFNEGNKSMPTQQLPIIEQEGYYWYDKEEKGTSLSANKEFVLN